MTLDRRRLLRLTGAAAVGSTTGLAGCADAVGLGNGTDTGDPPEYAGWIAADEDGDVFFAYTDWATLAEYSDVDGEPDEEEEETDDAMLAFVEVGLTASAMAISLGFATTTGLGALFEFDDEEDGFDSTLEETIMVDEALVCLGEFDADEIEAELTASHEMSFAAEFERTGEIGGYDRYEAVDDEDGAAVAVDGEAIVYASVDDGDSVDAIRRSIEAHAGDAERAAESSDDLEWLLGAADGHVAIGYHGDADEPDEADGEGGEDVDEVFAALEDATGAAGSLTVEGETESSGEFAAYYDGGIDGDLESDLESTLGDSAADVEVRVDGDRVTATGTWEGDPVTDDEDG